MMNTLYRFLGMEPKSSPYQEHVIDMIRNGGSHKREMKVESSDNTVVVDFGYEIILILMDCRINHPNGTVHPSSFQYVYDCPAFPPVEISYDDSRNLMLERQPSCSRSLPKVRLFVDRSPMIHLRKEAIVDGIAHCNGDLEQSGLVFSCVGNDTLEFLQPSRRECYRITYRGFGYCDFTKTFELFFGYSNYHMTRGELRNGTHAFLFACIDMMIEGQRYSRIVQSGKSIESPVVDLPPGVSTLYSVSTLYI